MLDHSHKCDVANQFATEEVVEEAVAIQIDDRCWNCSMCTGRIENEVVG